MSWSTKPSSKPLTMASFEETIAYMRRLARGDAPLFIQPTYAPYPAHWFCSRCRHANVNHYQCDSCTSCTVEGCNCDGFAYVNRKAQEGAK